MPSGDMRRRALSYILASIPSTTRIGRCLIKGDNLHPVRLARLWYQRNLGFWAEGVRTRAPAQTTSNGPPNRTQKEAQKREPDNRGIHPPLLKAPSNALVVNLPDTEKTSSLLLALFAALSCRSLRSCCAATIRSCSTPSVFCHPGPTKRVDCFSAPFSRNCSPRAPGHNNAGRLLIWHRVHQFFFFSVPS